MTDRMRLDLTPTEREVLWVGLSQWGGPVALRDDVARLIGFADAAEFYAQRSGLIDGALSHGLTPTEWRQSVALTEFAFISDDFGLGSEWTDFTELPDEQTVEAIRGLQDRLRYEVPG